MPSMRAFFHSTTICPIVLLGAFLMEASLHGLHAGEKARSSHGKHAKIPDDLPGLSAESVAIQSLGLDDAIRLALERSPAFQAAQERVNAVRGTTRSRSAPNNPELSIGATLVPEESEDPGEARSQFPDTDETNLRHTFPTSGRRRHRTRMANAELEEAIAQLRLEELELRSKVTDAYINLQLAQAIAGVQDEASRIARSFHEAAQGQHRLGLVPETDVMRTRIDLAQNEQDVLRACGDVRAKEEALGLLIGAPSGQRFRATDELPEGVISSTLEQLWAVADNHRPEVRMAAASLEAAQADVRLQQADRRPDLTVQTAFVDHLTNSGNPPMKAWVTLPLWDRGLIGGQVERARAEVRMKEQLLEQALRQARAEVTTAFRQLEAARQVFAVSREEIVPSALNLLEKARAAYVSGLGTLLQVLDAQRVYRQVCLDRLSTQGEVARSLNQLERATATHLRDSSIPEPSTNGAGQGAR